MEPSNATLIACASQVLDQRLAPLLDEEGSQVLSLARLALGELAARESVRSAEAADTCGRVVELLKTGSALVPLDRATSWSVAVCDTWQSFDHEEDRLRTELTALVKTVVEHRQAEGDAAWLSQASDWLKAVIQEEALRERRESVQAGDVADAESVEIDHDALAEHVRSRHAGELDDASFEFATVPGGFSRNTYFVTANRVAEKPVELVVRQEGRAGLMDGVSLELADEFVVMEFAHAVGVPSPQPRWFERDTAVMRGSFIVMDRNRGGVVGSAVAATQVEHSSVRQVAHALAKLHQSDWTDWADRLLPALQYDGSSVGSIRDVFAATLPRWRAFVSQKGITTSPGLEAALRWLELNIPDRPGSPSVIHGDIGFHNILFDGDHLTALLDWELADLGDPARDLVQMRQRVTEYVDWDQFMGWYVEAGGAPVDESVMKYYEVWYSVIATMTMMVAYENKLESLAIPPAEYLQLGLQFKSHFLAQLAASTSAVW